MVLVNWVDGSNSSQVSSPKGCSVFSLMAVVPNLRSDSAVNALGNDIRDEMRSEDPKTMPGVKRKAFTYFLTGGWDAFAFFGAAVGFFAVA
jgi:hypothetical protein